MKRHEKDFKKQILNIAKQTGTELTDTQVKIIEVFDKTETHTNPVELTERCLDHGIDTDEKTVEAMLQTLYQFGAALKHEFNVDGKTLVVYEHLHLTEHHDHFACVKCGDILDFYDRDLEETQNRLCKASGFTPLWHLTKIYGICGKCLGKLAPTLPLSFASKGEKVTVRKLQGGDKFKRRLHDMGIIPGLEIEVLNNEGPMLLAVRDSRVALGMGMASKILVSHDRIKKRKGSSH